MNQPENIDQKQKMPWIRRNWPFLPGIAFAFLWLVMAIAHWHWIGSLDPSLESGHYQTYQRHIDIIYVTAISGIGIAVLLFVVWKLKRESILDFRLIKTDWYGARASDRARTLFIRLTISILFIASILSCLAVFASAMVDQPPTILETVDLRGHTYHLAQRPSVDWDTNEILLYECSKSYTDCHLIHTEFVGNPDSADWQIDTAANTLSMVIYDRVVFVYDLPPR